MKQGFWWEFVARVHRGGYSIVEIPVVHRLRAAGVTQVYKASKMPGIFFRHFTALFKIAAQTGGAATRQAQPQLLPGSPSVTVSSSQVGYPAQRA